MIEPWTWTFAFQRVIFFKSFKSADVFFWSLTLTFGENVLNMFELFSPNNQRFNFIFIFFLGIRLKIILVKGHN
jgi:hypothetical protein